MTINKVLQAGKPKIPVHLIIELLKRHLLVKTNICIESLKSNFTDWRKRGKFWKLAISGHESWGVFLRTTLYMTLQIEKPIIHVPFILNLIQRQLLVKNHLFWKLKVKIRQMEKNWRISLKNYSTFHS